jgi:serine/threonine protein kinase
MPWPSNIDYQEAFQTPTVCFEDAELKAGVVEKGPLGLPRPFAGNFASVYKVRFQNHSYAVRCFLREFSDQQQRYQAITNHLRTANLACIVRFDFVARGILVKGIWRPVLKMEWVEGNLLHHVIERSLAQPAMLSELARKWLELCRLLRASGIAHGDLQHGNILIVNGQFKLID